MATGSMICNDLCEHLAWEHIGVHLLIVAEVYGIMLLVAPIAYFLILMYENQDRYSGFSRKVHSNNWYTACNIFINAYQCFLFCDRAQNKEASEFFFFIELLFLLIHSFEFIFGQLSASARSMYSGLEFAATRGLLEACIIGSTIAMTMTKTWWSLGFLGSLRLGWVVQSHLAVARGQRSERIETAIITGHLFCWVFFCAMVVMSLEIAGNPEWLPASRDWTVMNAAYYVSVTVLTVGYGDFSPSTATGRMFCILLIASGISLITYMLNDVMTAVNKRRMGYIVFSNRGINEQHVVVTGNPTSEVATDFIREFYHPDRDSAISSVVFLVPDVSVIREPVTELLKHKAYSVCAERVYFLCGSALEPSDLARADPANCSCFFVFPSTLEESRYEQDRKSLLETFQLRESAPHARAVVLLLSYNPAFERQFKLDPMVDPICLEQLRLKLLGKSCLVPGFAALTLNLFTTFESQMSGEMPVWQQDYARGLEMELYEEELSTAYCGCCFGDVVMDVLSRSDERDVMLIGLVLDDDSIVIHPGQDFVIPFDGTVYGVFIARDVVSIIQAQQAGFSVEHKYETMDAVVKRSGIYMGAEKDLSATLITATGGKMDAKTLWEQGVIEGQALFAKKLLVEATVEPDLIADLSQLDRHIDQAVQTGGNHEREMMAKSMGTALEEPEGLYRYQAIDKLVKTPAEPSMGLLQKGGHILLISCGGPVADFVWPLRNPVSEMPPVVVLAMSTPPDWYALVDVPEVFLVIGSMRSLADLHRAGVKTSRAIALQTNSKTGVDSNRLAEEPHLVDSEVLFTAKLIESQFTIDEVKPFILSELMMSTNQSFLETRDEARTGGEYYLKKIYASGKVFMSTAMTSLCVAAYYSPSLCKLINELVKAQVLVINVPPGWERRPYGDLLKWLMWEKNLLAIGLYRRSGAKKNDLCYVFSAPPNEDITLFETDKVYCVVPSVVPQAFNTRAPPRSSPRDVMSNLSEEM